ncbi:hypothetical protein [Rhodopseudomonas pseudopalustris]|uniref:hypothetical protein n=1 Tax=Rhodopseudomonas pseudopalustris TaxID=1513892 RepID=UPI001113A1DE|nr:hypothetical protein [Rhodopseudomonas pseudopalustris]
MFPKHDDHLLATLEVVRVLNAGLYERSLLVPRRSVRRHALSRGEAGRLAQEGQAFTSSGGPPPKLHAAPKLRLEAIALKINGACHLSDSELLASGSQKLSVCSGFLLDRLVRRIREPKREA